MFPPSLSLFFTTSLSLIFSLSHHSLSFLSSHSHNIPSFHVLVSRFLSLSISRSFVLSLSLSLLACQAAFSSLKRTGQGFFARFSFSRENEIPTSSSIEFVPRRRVVILVALCVSSTRSRVCLASNNIYYVR